MRRLMARLWSYRTRTNLAVWLNAAWLMPRIAGAGSGRKSREKEAKRQEDVARQREQFQNDSNQFLSQLTPGSAEWQEMQELARRGLSDSGQREAFFTRAPQLIQQQQARIASGGPATALEARTNLAVGEAPVRSPTGQIIKPGTGLRGAAAPQDFEQDILNVLSGLPTTTPTGQIAQRGLEFSPEQQELFQALRGGATTSDLGRIFQDVISRAAPGGTGLESELERALRGESTTTPLGAQATRMVDIAGQDPDTAFSQELALLQDQINRQANARGLATSGIPIEQLGRAGIELAVRKASERENIRRTREADVLDLMTRSQQGRAESLSNVERLFAQGEAGTQRQQDMLAALFGTGEQLRGREIGVEEAVTNLQAGRESNLTALLQSQTGNAMQNLLDLLSTQTGRSENLRDRASALREAERQRLESMFTDVNLEFGPLKIKKTPTATSFGQAAPTTSLTRDRSAGTDIESLISEQHKSQGGIGQPSQQSGLSRRRQDDFDYEAFAKLFGSR